MHMTSGHITLFLYMDKQTLSTVVARHAGTEGVGELWELAEIAIGWVGSPLIALLITGEVSVVARWPKFRPSKLKASSTQSLRL
jgi:hypothetical protein